MTLCNPVTVLSHQLLGTRLVLHRGCVLVVMVLLQWWFEAAVLKLMWLSLVLLRQLLPLLL